MVHVARLEFPCGESLDPSRSCADGDHSTHREEERPVESFFGNLGICPLYLLQVLPGDLIEVLFCERAPFRRICNGSNQLCVVSPTRIASCRPGNDAPDESLDERSDGNW